MPEPTDVEEVSGVALAGFWLSVNMVRLLADRGLIEREEVATLVTAFLSSLEHDENFSETAAHTARTLLGGLAEEFGATPKKRN